MDSSMDKSNNNKFIDSIKSLVESAFNNNQSNPFLGTKSEKGYKFSTYKEIKIEIDNLSSYFLNKIIHQKLILDEEKLNSSDNFYSKFSHKGNEHLIIGVYTKPCEEALKLLLAIHSTDQNITVVSIFDNLHRSKLKKIIEESEIKTLVLDEECLKLVMDNLTNDTDNIFKLGIIKNILLIKKGKENVSNQHEKTLKEEYFINLIHYSDIILPINENKILKNDNNLNNKIQERIILLTYTSGSKGVLISEKSLISSFKSLLSSDKLKLNSEDVYYSLTSIADVPEYLNNLIIMHAGASIGYFSGDGSKIFEDIQILKPTVLYSFPRAFIKIYEALQGIINKLDEAKKNLIEKAIKAKIEHFQNEKSLSHHIWDKVVFNKMKNTLGGRIKLILVGGHLSTKIIEFLKICLCANLTEIYGLTETCGIITLSSNSELDSKFIGAFINSVQFEIKKCNKIGYYSTYVNSNEAQINNYGEICIKGDNLFSGYFKNNLTSDLVDEDGYFHTGDYAISLDCSKDNSLNIKYIDKIENFIITKQGFFISPSQLEEIYGTSDYITHISIISDQFLNLIAIVILDKNKIFKKREHADSMDSLRNRSFNGNVKYRNDKKNKIIKESKVRSISFSENTENISISSTDSETDMDDDLSYFDNCGNLIFNPNTNEILKEEIMRSFNIIWNENKLKNCETINKIYILDKNIYPSVENGLLNSKLKLKRESLKKIYMNAIQYLDNEKIE